MEEELICLRAIRDVNVPKFLLDDLKLFRGIVSDLFPGVKEDPVDYGTLLSSIQESCRSFNLEHVEGFVNKCIQVSPHFGMLVTDFVYIVPIFHLAL